MKRINIKVKPKSAIGIAMLDVISNALAGTMVLFFTLSAVQLEPAEAKRVLGILVVRIELESRTSGAYPPSIFVKAPKSGHRHYPFKYDEEILRLNDDYEDRIISNEMDPINIYEDPENPLIIEIVINNPKEGWWQFGSMYIDHTEYHCGPQNINMNFRAFFIPHNGEILKNQYKFKTLSYPTQYNLLDVEISSSDQSNS